MILMVYCMIVFHAWILFCLFLGVGYITCTDYYDKFSNKFLEYFKKMSLITVTAILLSIILVIASNGDPAHKVTFEQGYGLVAFFSSIVLTTGSVLMFFCFAENIRKYFGKKRGKTVKSKDDYYDYS